MIAALSQRESAVPLLNPLLQPSILAIANSALLISLLETLVEKRALEKEEAKLVVKTAIKKIKARSRIPESMEAINALEALSVRFSQQ
jgi:hypothetical protein